MNDRPTLRQRLLGLFVVGQLGFVVGVNALDYLAERRDLPSAVEAGRSGLHGWARLSGQWQEWKLFAPEVSTSSRFATLELRWQDGSARQLRSEFEPANPLDYWRPPGAADRRFNFEANIATRLYVAWDADTLRRQGPAFQEARRATLQTNWRPTLAYLRWRLARFQAEEPLRSPPREVILLLRGEVEKPLVRWRLDASPAPVLPLEVYDPATRQFERVGKR
jgi:hypothetical protein